MTRRSTPHSPAPSTTTITGSAAIWYLYKPATSWTAATTNRPAPQISTMPIQVLTPGQSPQISTLQKTAKTMINIRASQNDGIEIPAKQARLISVSVRV